MTAGPQVTPSSSDIAKLSSTSSSSAMVIVQATHMIRPGAMLVNLCSMYPSFPAGSWNTIVCLGQVSPPSSDIAAIVCSPARPLPRQRGARPQQPARGGHVRAERHLQGAVRRYGHQRRLGPCAAAVGGAADDALAGRRAEVPRAPPLVVPAAVGVHRPAVRRDGQLQGVRNRRVLPGRQDGALQGPGLAAVGGARPVAAAPGHGTLAPAERAEDVAVGKLHGLGKRRLAVVDPARAQYLYRWHLRNPASPAPR